MEKMEAAKLQERAKEYLKAFDSIKEWTCDERSAMAILQEVTKDIRMAQIREERANGVSFDNNGEAPATERQRNFLKKLGVNAPKKLTKKEASALIDEELGRESGQDSSLRNAFEPVRVVQENITTPWYGGRW